MSSPASSRGNFSEPTSRLTVPFASFALVLLAAFTLCAGFGYVLAERGDAAHQEHRRAAFLTVIDEFRTVFANSTLQQANAIGLEGGLVGPLSPQQTARWLVPSGLARYRHVRACIIGADDSIIGSFPVEVNGILSPIARFIDRFRAEHPSLAGAADGPEAEAERLASDMVVLDDQIALAAIATIEVPVKSLLNRGGPPLLVRMVKLDPALIAVFEKMSGITDLKLTRDAPPADRQVQSVLDAQGRIVGWYSWKTEHPMADAVFRLAPMLAALAACLVGFAALAIRQIGRTTRQLAVSQAEAYRKAYEDPVTGLPNRRAIFDALDAALERRATDRAVAFAFIDIEGFKDINEALGLQAGDELLAAVGRRLRAAMPDGATLGRFGADEFAMVVPDGDQTNGLTAAQAAVEAMAQPFAIVGQIVQINVTIGLVRAPADGEGRDDLVRRADLARRSIKHGGRHRVAGFEHALEQAIRDRLFVKRELRRALADRDFAVHYQPIVAADGQKIVGVEALLRWTHATRGQIPPSDFIPVAEQTGVMHQLGEFVLRRALADAVPWKGVYIAVNLSPVQVRDRALVGLVAQVLKETGIAPSRVVLEITEGVLIDNPDEAKERLEQLRALGVKIALDDFGSGYSSLSYLRRFPIDKLKIDKEFVAPLGRSADGGVIIQAITALGRALGLSVLCEGVETEEQRILLRLAGCDEMQGFLFARPAPRAAIDRLIASAQEGRARRMLGA
jgi:diguanylate cyclase (GGDEF)-like protein